MVIFGLFLIICNGLFLYNDYGFYKTLFIQFLFAVGFGSSWNLIAGLCGYYSFGHALYAGIASYFLAFGLLYTNIPLLMVIFLTLAFCAMVGALIAYISTRFDVEFAYFTLLTIAFLECGRIFFEVNPWFGATSGLFLTADKVPPIISHYFLPILSFVVLGISVFCAVIINSKLGYKCKAVKDNKKAARALGIIPHQGIIIVMSLSTLLTGVMGIFYLFYQKNLFPDQVFSMPRSMGFTLAPLIGGVGGVVSPIIGSLFLIPLGEFIDYGLDFFDLAAPGIKQIIFGCIILFVIFKMPEGMFRYNSFTKSFAKVS